jgi:hypothetical protein
MNSNDASEFRKNHPFFSFLSDEEIHVRHVPSGLTSAAKAMIAARPEQRQQIGAAIELQLAARYTKKESVDPQPLPKITHVASGHDVELLDSHRVGPWVSWTVKFPDGTIRSCTADEFLAAPGSTTMTTAKVQKGASRGFQAGDRVANRAGEIGKVRQPTGNHSTTFVEFSTAAGTRMELVPNVDLFGVA